MIARKLSSLWFAMLSQAGWQIAGGADVQCVLRASEDVNERKAFNRRWWPEASEVGEIIPFQKLVVFRTV